jgi:hypothetical protein
VRVGQLKDSFFTVTNDECVEERCQGDRIEGYRSTANYERIAVLAI